MSSILHRIPAMANAEIRQMCNGPESFTPDMHAIIGETPEVISERAQSCSCSIEISDTYVYIYICGRTSTCSVSRNVGGVKCGPLSKA